MAIKAIRKVIMALISLSKFFFYGEFSTDS